MSDFKKKLFGTLSFKNGDYDVNVSVRSVMSFRDVALLLSKSDYSSDRVISYWNIYDQWSLSQALLLRQNSLDLVRF